MTPWTRITNVLIKLTHFSIAGSEFLPYSVACLLSVAVTTRYFKKRVKRYKTIIVNIQVFKVSFNFSGHKFGHFGVVKAAELPVKDSRSNQYVYHANDNGRKFQTLGLASRMTRLRKAVLVYGVTWRLSEDLFQLGNSKQIIITELQGC